MAPGFNVKPPVKVLAALRATARVLLELKLSFPLPEMIPLEVIWMLAAAPEAPVVHVWLAPRLMEVPRVRVSSEELMSMPAAPRVSVPPEPALIATFPVGSVMEIPLKDTPAPTVVVLAAVVMLSQVAEVPVGTVRLVQLAGSSSGRALSSLMD